MTNDTFNHSENNGHKQRHAFFAISDSYDSLAEINHRISNNLALLASTVSMRAAGFARRKEPVDAREVAVALHEITARIAILGHMHRLLSTRPGSDHAQFGPHLRELCRLFIAALAAPGKWELIEREIADCSVPADRFLPLSLIVTEVVTNALKYAHPTGVPGKLAVGCRCEPDGTIVVEVSDDGVGLPEGYELDAGGGIGSRTIHVLAQQIDAELAFDSRPTGLRFALRLPGDGGA